jgi:hypothetical protein
MDRRLVEQDVVQRTNLSAPPPNAIAAVGLGGREARDGQRLRRHGARRELRRPWKPDVPTWLLKCGAAQAGQPVCTNKTPFTGTERRP